LDEAVQPAAEQKASVQKILDASREQVERFRGERGQAMRAATEKAWQARRGNDAEAAKAAQAEFEQHRKARQEIFDNLSKQLGEVLSADQMTKAAPLIKELADGGDRPRRRPQTPEAVLQGLGLSDEQQAKAKTILADAEAQAGKTDDEQLQQSLRKDAMDRIAETVLTDEQKQQFLQTAQRGRRGGRGGRGGEGEGGRRGPNLQLTDEQQTQRDEIMQAAREQARNAEDRGERRRIMGEAMRKVHDEIFTDEQRQQLRQQMRQNSPLGRMGASEEQMDQAETIMRDAREKAREVESREERREIFRAAMQRVRDEVLTEEQRQQMQEMRRERQENGEQRRGRRRQRRENRQDGQQDPPAPETDES
jgi:hypothetical protein